MQNLLKRTLMLLLTLTIIGGCSKLKKNDKDVEIRSDMAPIEKRLPEFPETKEIYWISTILGEDSPGPTSLQLDIWAVLDDKTFEAFIKDAKLTDIKEFTPTFYPDEMEESYSWEKLDDSYVFNTQKLGVSQFNSEIYFDEKSCTIYVQAVGKS